MDHTEYIKQKMRTMMIDKNVNQNHRLIAAQIKEQSQKVQLTGLVCGKDAIALSGVDLRTFYAAKRFNPKEFPQEIVHEQKGYIWYRKQDIIDFFEKYPAKRQGRKE